MQVSSQVVCRDFPCPDVRHEGYLVPASDVDPERISVVLISEAAAADPADDYYAPGDPLFQRTTVEAFRLAGAQVASVQDILDLGVYLTTAVKCAKISYNVSAKTIGCCSQLLEAELALFPRARALLLMGDVAIKAVNAIARRVGEPRPVPAGSTYKLRGQPYTFRGMRVFPSYLQAGPAFFIEASKRRMIAEDIAQALRLVGAA